jgi:tetratricopeptide (TPR) repeat protein
MTDAGYISVELNKINLALKAPHDGELLLRVDVEILNGIESLTWNSSGSNKYSSANIDAFKLEENVDANDELVYYRLGFDNQFIRSSYIDLTGEILTSIGGASVSVKIVYINKSAQEANEAASKAPPAKGKGAPTEVVQIPSEEVYVEFIMPLANLFQIKGCVYENNGFQLEEKSPIKCIISNDNIVDTSSSFSFIMQSDNDLAEYVMGGLFLNWSSSSLKLSASHHQWGLHAPDVVDAKAKIQPTVAELREKYLENIKNLITTQNRVCNYSLLVSGADDKLLSTLNLSNGLIAYNFEEADTVPEEEDIRERGDLWSLTWGSSPSLFFHRSVKKNFASILANDENYTLLNLKVSKENNEESVAVEGENISLEAPINVINMSTPGTCNETFEVNSFNDVEDNDAMVLSIVLTSSSPLIALPATAEEIAKKNAKISRPADVVSGKFVNQISSNRNVLQELRDQISQTIKEIANEYLILFPLSIEQAQIEAEAEGGSGHSLNINERKAEFMHFLSSHGIYHSLKEKLKPKIQRVVREKYGVRGKSLGLDNSNLNQEDFNASSSTISGEPVESRDSSYDQLLGELYVFLVKECSIVLNQMFTNTLVDFNSKEVEAVGLIDDEKETPGQIFSRLLNQANDVEADGRSDAAEQLHLERIQLLSHQACLGSEPVSVQDAYFKYGEFLLRLSSSIMLQASFGSSNDSDNVDENRLTVAREHLSRAREAIQIAYDAKPEDWLASLVLASLLVETGHIEDSEIILTHCISSQLNKSNDFELNTLEGFEGYESDSLCPVEPLCYSVLSALFSLQSKALPSRKALRMANRSFVEGNHEPHVDTHGTPRRTVVICMSNAASFLFKYGLNILGNECLRLAISCETAATEKAQARGKPTLTVPFVRYLLKKVESHSLIQNLSKGGRSVDDRDNDLSKSMSLSNDSIDAAVEPLDILNANIMYVKSLSVARSDNDTIIAAYLNIIKISVDQSLVKYVPLECFVQSAKLLINFSRYQDALSILLVGCKQYSSSTLFLLAGICCIRLEKYEDAEDSLIEANLLDNKNSDIWAYLSLLCLSIGPHRSHEAEKSMTQSIKLGLNSSTLLRELATSFMAVDKLQIAEDLIRRAISLEISISSKANARTRKLLADLLSSQNQAALAVDEYQKVIGDDDSDVNLKRISADKCSSLLSSLGRYEELSSLKMIIKDLSATNITAGQ